MSRDITRCRRDPRSKHAVTFTDAMEAVIDLHRSGWKPTSNTEQQWRSLLAHHIAPTIGTKAVADAAFNKLLAEHDIDGPAHGFRATFRSWCSDQGVPRDLAETALGHAVKDRTEAAYARSDMLQRRRPLMEDWASHIA